MRVVEADTDPNTEDAYIRCLHTAEPPNQEVLRIRREWYAESKAKGLRAKVLLDDSERVVACLRISEQSCHSVRSKVASEFGVKLPPISVSKLPFFG